jgi:hypothetical protein
MTDKYGKLRVIRSFQEGSGPRVVHLLENGAYVWDTGLPVQDLETLLAALPKEQKPAAREWWENRHKKLENPARKLDITQDNRVVFADDGSPVTNVQDIIDYFEPGPFREAALVAFAQGLAESKAKKGAGPLDQAPPRKVVPPKKKVAASARKAPPKPAVKTEPAEQHPVV